MRIALLSSAAVVHSFRWGRGLAERGAEVRLLSLEPPVMKGAETTGFSLHQISSPAVPGFLRYPGATATVRRELETFSPHLIDAHFVPNYGLLGALVGRRPLVIHCWGSDLLIARDPLRRLRARWILAQADRVFTDAANLASAATGLGVGEDRLRLVPWGIDLDRFAFQKNAQAKKQARESWPESWRFGSDQSGPVIASTRNLEPIYDVATVLRAWPEIKKEIAGAVCLVAGDGSERRRLEDLSTELGITESVRFLGRLSRNDLTGLLAGAELYLSTSRSDSTSLSLLEAMGAGCYPVVSEIEGNREWLTAETAGWFAVGDFRALARAVVEACSGGDLGQARVANRRRVVEKADWRRTMDRVLQEYQELVGHD